MHQKVKTLLKRLTSNFFTSFFFIVSAGTAAKAFISPVIVTDDLIGPENDVEDIENDEV